MRTFIRERIKQGADCNFAIVVPTKALINEVSRAMFENLGDLLRENDYRIVTSAGTAVLQGRNSHHYSLCFCNDTGMADAPIDRLCRYSDSLSFYR